MITATEPEMKALGELPPGIDCRVTGVGVPSTIYQLQKALSGQSYDLVIQAGIAGSFKEEIAIGEVVKVEADYFADLGIFEKKILTPLFKSHLADPTGRYYPEGMLNNKGEVHKKVDLPSVAAITVNRVSDETEHNKLMKNTFSPDIESMEGAGLHFVCIMEKVDYLQIRAISNSVGERDKGQWQIEKALENLKVELDRVVAPLTT